MKFENISALNYRVDGLTTRAPNFFIKFNHQLNDSCHYSAAAKFLKSKNKKQVKRKGII